MRCVAFRQSPYLLFILTLSACRGAAGGAPPVSPPPSSTAEARPTPTAEQVIAGCIITPLPEDSGFDAFYERGCDAGGIPIISTVQVDEQAFEMAYDVITNMLAPIPDIRQLLVDRGAYFAITPKSVGITALPEFSHLDSAYWDRRARGLGGTRWSRITAGPEENLLCLGRDVNYGESISVHEFAHTIHLAGLAVIDPAFDMELRRLYKIAMANKLWLGTYVQTGYEEYWAEGVQSYFNTNLEAYPEDGIHNLVDTPEELAEYDPRLFALIDGVFKGYEWTPTCPED
jgi:hypothetical protein